MCGLNRIVAVDHSLCWKGHHLIEDNLHQHGLAGTGQQACSFVVIQGVATYYSGAVSYTHLTLPTMAVV